MVSAGLERDVKVWSFEENNRDAPLFEFKNAHYCNILSLNSLILIGIAELSRLSISEDSNYFVTGARGINIYDFRTKKIIYQNRDYHGGISFRRNKP